MSYNRRQANVLKRAQEGLSLAAIAAEEGQTDLKTMRDWLAEDPTFVERLKAAREVWSDRVRGEILEIADSLAAGCTEREYRVARLRIDARREALCRLGGKAFPEEDEGLSAEAPLPPIDLELV